MARRLRIKLEVVSPTMSMTTEIGRNPKEPGYGSDPTEGDYDRANLAMRLIAGMPMRDQDRALFEACANGRKGARRV